VEPSPLALPRSMKTAGSAGAAVQLLLLLLLLVLRLPGLQWMQMKIPGNLLTAGLHMQRCVVGKRRAGQAGTQCLCEGPGAILPSYHTRVHCA
jgi:hypothetical protein